MRKKLTPILIALCYLFNSNVIGSNSTTWELYFENDTVKIEYTYKNCDFSSTSSQEIIILKFTNLSEETVH